MNKLFLPCLRGVIGDWTYYATVMKIRDVVNNHRIITVSESPDLYTKNIGEVLQREINHKRTNSISQYLKTNKERFFSSLTVAIHKGNPQWFDIDLGAYFEIQNEKVDNENLTFIENKFGILALTGEEKIFALDGQHRLLGLRDALENDDVIGDEEVSLIFVVHNDKHKERTRRLFTVLNKYAEKPRGAELIILDEDDAAAINTRRLVEEHPQLKKENALSDSKSGNISQTDISSFTTLVTINNINKHLYSKPKSFYTIRPSEKIINELYTVSSNFWDCFFECFPEAIRFIDGENGILLNGRLFNRNKNSGGSLLLRPVGQELFAKAYQRFLKKEAISLFKTKIRSIDFDLSGPIFRYLFWNNGKMLSKENELKNRTLPFLLGENISQAYIDKEFERIYLNFNLTYVKGSIKPIRVRARRKNDL